MNSRLIFFALLIQLSTAQASLPFPAGIELCSLFYDDDTGFKVNVLYATIYDEQATKEETEKIEWLTEETPKNYQKIEETNQEIIKTVQKTTETEQLIKETEESIKRKKDTLRNMLSKL